MGRGVKNHRNLEVWQVSTELVDEVYEITGAWPKHELYGMVSQIRRAAVSVPANIAEGNGRRTAKDYLRFLDMAYGSLIETDTLLFIAKRRAYITSDLDTKLMTLLERIAMMLNALMSSIERRAKAEL